jgi:hypothetical protein
MHSLAAADPNHRSSDVKDLGDLSAAPDHLLVDVPSELC